LSDFRPLVKECKNKGLSAVETYETIVHTFPEVATYSVSKNVCRAYSKNESKRVKQLLDYSVVNRKVFSVWESQFNGWLCNWRLKHQWQAVIGPYIVDFRLTNYRIIIELDGKQHDNAIDYDTKRTEYLTRLGYKVIRFKNDERFDKQAVKSKIFAFLIEDNEAPTKEV
jgi:very-short-patch-repair endonuclease